MGDHDSSQPNPTPAPRAPTARHIYEMIMQAAERQIETSVAAQSIIEVVTRNALYDLVAQIAANAANPIADLLEDALHDLRNPDCVP
jgi:hypothetical protein